MISNHEKYVKSPSDREKLVFAHASEHATYLPPLHVAFAGVSVWGAGHSITRNCSNIFCIELVTAGNLDLTQEHQSYTVETGQVFILRKGCRHVYATGPAGFVHKRFVSISGPLLEPLLQMSGLWNVDCIRIIQQDVINALLKKIYGLVVENREEHVTRLSALAFELIAELGKGLKPQYPVPVKKAIEFMNQNLARQLTLAEICSHIGTSPTHFNRLFCRYIHCAPITFFIRQRLSWAQQILSTTSLSIKEVSQMVGYDNPLYFSAQFKKCFKMSPRFFVQSLQKKGV